MNNFNQHYGHWGVAAIILAIASWILYRYVAPQRWFDSERLMFLGSYVARE